MKNRSLQKILGSALLLLASVAHGNVRADTAPEETLQFGRFENVHIYRNSAHPEHVVLLASGDGGWNQGVVDMARSLSRQHALVAGVDVPAYLRRLEQDKDACSYPAADFEGLSQYLQRHYDYPDYVQPVLVGYSSGAALVYATLAQSPPNTFYGAISLGFCPELPLAKPLCAGSGLKTAPGKDGKGLALLPISDPGAPWIVLQGEQDKACAGGTTARFVAQVADAHSVVLPKVAHGFSIGHDWMPQLRDSFSQLVADRPRPAARDKLQGLEDLPLVEVSAQKPGKTFAVVLSGDGGWASIDKSLADTLSGKGIPVVGLDSMHYFWTERSADEMGNDLTRILQHYFSAWNMDRVLLIGYSRGADVLPFMASRLSRELFSRTGLIALLGAEHDIEFEFHVSDWLPGSLKDSGHKVKPELEKLAHDNVLCIYGADESEPLCPDLDPQKFTIHRMPGGHHFGGDYNALAELIIRAAH